MSEDGFTDRQHQVLMVLAVPAMFVVSWIALAVTAVGLLLHGKVRQLAHLVHPSSGARL